MILKRQAQVTARAAFTLMEMLVVVAILVVLAGAAVPIYLNYLANARIDRAKVDCKNLATAVEAYQAKIGQFPPSLQTLTQAQQDPNTGQVVRATLEPASLMDPWGNPYQYDPNDLDQNTGRIRVWSKGPPGGQPIASR
jgi:general secretion pathway protein G